MATFKKSIKLVLKKNYPNLSVLVLAVLCRSWGVEELKYNEIQWMKGAASGPSWGAEEIKAEEEDKMETRPTIKNCKHGSKKYINGSHG